MLGDQSVCCNHSIIYGAIAARHNEHASQFAILAAKYGSNFNIISGDDTCQKASTILSTLPYFLNHDVNVVLPSLTLSTLEHLLSIPWVVDELHLKTHIITCSGMRHPMNHVLIT